VVDGWDASSCGQQCCRSNLRSNLLFPLFSFCDMTKHNLTLEEFLRRLYSRFLHFHEVQVANREPFVDAHRRFDGSNGS